MKKWSTCLHTVCKRYSDVFPNFAVLFTPMVLCTLDDLRTQCHKVYSFWHRLINQSRIWFILCICFATGFESFSVGFAKTKTDSGFGFGLDFYKVFRLQNIFWKVVRFLLIISLWNSCILFWQNEKKLFYLYFYIESVSKLI